MIWKYSDQCWYFGRIPLLQCQIDLILTDTKRKLNDLQLFSLPKRTRLVSNVQFHQTLDTSSSLPKFQNPTFLKAKTNLEVDPLVKNGCHFYFPFMRSMCFKVLKVINMKMIQDQPCFWLQENIVFHFFFMEA